MVFYIITRLASGCNALVLTFPCQKDYNEAKSRRRFHILEGRGGMALIEISSTALSVFGLTVRWYGVLITLGVLCAFLLAARREKRLGLPPDTALDLVLCGLPAAIVGARLYYVIFAWDAFANDPVSALYIWQGGLAIYGGLIGGVLAGAVYGRVKKLPFLKLADLAAPSLALGQAVGRWGNFLNQEAYGALARHDWQKRFPISVLIAADGQWHCATFFYESAWCLMIVIVLLLLERRNLFRRDGARFTGYVFLYALERALVEGLRTDSLMWGPVRVSQALSLVALIVCAGIILARRRRKVLPAAGLILCLAMAALLIVGHPWLALICAAGALACEGAGLIMEAKTD